ncbi:MAG: polysulfide reductase NrfD [Xanthobacteraceae bacterium]|nr:polysulfide reductase NrfD [Xanthobacteraceae bacterium]
MAKVAYQKLEDHGSAYWGLLALNAIVLLAGLGAASVMEHRGHIVTGMTNRIVWGTPHVFAVFLIVAASGALNIASISSVFGRSEYKPYARLSGLLAIALLIGGLAVLVLDLGRPDRLIVAMTTYNFKSIFAWNIFLYVGFLAIVAAYLFVMMDRRASRMSHIGSAVGGLAFAWRLILTTGTGSIFGWLVAREAYGAAIMAPLFIAASLLYGLAFTVLALAGLEQEKRRDLLSDEMTGKFRGLLAIFILAVLHLTAVHHLTNLYASERHGVERFLLLAGGSYTVAFWVGQILVGSMVPLAILALPRLGRSRTALIVASALCLAGGLAQMYVIIIGGQAFPLNLFPGMEVMSSFQDGQVAAYRASLPEVLLGLSGLSLAVLVAGIAVKLLPFLPRPTQ